MSPEWTVIMATLGYLTDTEINAFVFLVEQADFSINDAEPVPLTTISSAEPFTNEAVEAGMECNICAPPFAHFPLQDRCHPAIKTYLCRHVFDATCLQSWWTPTLRT